MANAKPTLNLANFTSPSIRNATSVKSYKRTLRRISYCVPNNDPDRKSDLRFPKTEKPDRNESDII